jgi:hypothetical protein
MSCAAASRAPPDLSTGCVAVFKCRFWGPVGFSDLYRLPVMPRYGRVNRRVYHVWGMDDVGLFLS